jgi:hypothetical protein
MAKRRVLLGGIGRTIVVREIMSYEGKNILFCSNIWSHDKFTFHAGKAGVPYRLAFRSRNINSKRFSYKNAARRIRRQMSCEIQFYDARGT